VVRLKEPVSMPMGELNIKQCGIFGINGNKKSHAKRLRRKGEKRRRGKEKEEEVKEKPPCTFFASSSLCV
jgi:hypothetical protein